MNASKWTPLRIQITLHYLYSPTMYPRRSSYADQVEQDLVRTGFIEMSDDNTYYVMTPKGRVWAERLRVAAYQIEKRLNRDAPAERKTAKDPNLFAPYGASNFAPGGSAKLEDIAEPGSVRVTIGPRGGFTGGTLKGVADSPHYRSWFADAMQRMKAYTTADGAVFGDRPKYINPVKEKPTLAESWSGNLLSFGYGCNNDEATKRFNAYLSGQTWEEYQAENEPRVKKTSPSFDVAYERFTRLGNALKTCPTGFPVPGPKVTASQWKYLFDIVFARTDKLDDIGLAGAIYRAMNRARLCGETSFDHLRKLALETPRVRVHRRYSK